MRNRTGGDSLPELQLLFRRDRGKWPGRSPDLRKMPTLQTPERENLQACTKKTTQSAGMIYNNDEPTYIQAFYGPFGKGSSLAGWPFLFVTKGGAPFGAAGAI